MKRESHQLIDNRKYAEPVSAYKPIMFTSSCRNHLMYCTEYRVQSQLPVHCFDLQKRTKEIAAKFMRQESVTIEAAAVRQQ